MENYSIFVLIQKESADLADAISKENKCDGTNIIISTRVFHSADSLYECIENTEKPNYILVFDNIHYFRINRDKARSETLEVLKKISLSYDDIKIVTIISKDKENETLPFIQGLIVLGLHDFYLTDEVKPKILLNWLIKEKKQRSDNEKYLNTNIEIKEVIKEVVKEPQADKEPTSQQTPAPKVKKPADPVPQERKAPEAPAPALQEPKKEPAPKPAPPQKSRSAQQIIGIIGAAVGTGTTTLCISYAKYLTEVMKEKVLILDRTENKHLSKVKVNGIDVKNCFLADVKISDYDRILIDFGPLAKVEVEGKVLLYDDLMNEKKMERQYCNNILLVASYLPWRLHEIKGFIEDNVLNPLSEDWIFYLSGAEEYFQEKVKKQYGQHRTVFIHHEHKELMRDLDELLENRRK